MTFAPSPPESESGDRQNDATPAQDARIEENPKQPQDRRESGAPFPWHHRVWFWSLLGLLAGLFLILLFLRGCVVELPVLDEPSKADARLAELVELQKNHNQRLEAELRRLQGLLREDPCTILGAIGASSDKTPAAPGHGESEPIAPEKRKTDVPSGESERRGGAQPEGGGIAPSSEEPAVPSPGGAKESGVSAGNAVAPATVPVPVPSSIGEIMEQATVFILSAYDGTTGMGSGFFVAPGVIATNSHVVQNREAEVFIGNKAMGGMRRASVLAFSDTPDRDYALLRVSGGMVPKTPVLRVADGVKRTERVSAWGFPGYITRLDPKLEALIRGDDTSVPEVVYSEGVVSVVLEQTPPVILHTASLSQGNSGGPLVNAQGIVVGINTFIRRADQSYSQASIALSGSDLATFMRENGVTATKPK